MDVSSSRCLSRNSYTVLPRWSPIDPTPSRHLGVCVGPEWPRVGIFQWGRRGRRLAVPFGLFCFDISISTSDDHWAHRAFIMAIMATGDHANGVCTIGRLCEIS